MYINDLASLGTTQRTQFRPNLPQVLPMTFPIPPKLGTSLTAPMSSPCQIPGLSGRLMGNARDNLGRVVNVL